MKLLREYIREMLLTEAAKGPADLPDGYFVRFSPSGPDEMDFIIVTQDGEWTPGVPKWAAATQTEDGFSGVVQIAKVDLPNDGPCSSAWQVVWSEATDGFGPLLYDLAMEYATKNGGGLMGDRSTVSTSARKVWDYYQNRRGDVDSIQLDDVDNTLTVGDEDNCDQRVAGGHGYRQRRDPDDIVKTWYYHPLSKAYQKSPDSATQELKRLGKLVE